MCKALKEELSFLLYFSSFFTNLDEKLACNFPKSENNMRKREKADDQPEGESCISTSLFFILTSGVVVCSNLNTGHWVIGV